MQKTDFLIRAATEQDFSAILDLWNRMMAEHQAFDPRIRLAEGAEAAYRAYLAYHVRNDESRVGVAEADESDSVAAFCLCSINRNLPMFLPPRYGYLSDLVVGDAVRRRGIGRALVLDARLWLRGHSIGSMQLQVYTENSGAAAFWRAMGFESFYDRMWLEVS